MKFNVIYGFKNIQNLKLNKKKFSTKIKHTDNLFFIVL